MKVPCPICHKYIDTLKNSEIVCENCKCKLYSDNFDKLKIVESGIEFSLRNLIFSGLLISIFIFFLVLLLNGEVEVVSAGLVFILIPFVILIRLGLLHLNNYDYLGIFGLFNALTENKLKYYDIASQLFIFLYLTMSLTGIIMLIVGWVLK